MTDVPTIADCSPARMTFATRVMRKVLRNLPAAALGGMALTLAACQSTSGPTLSNGPQGQPPYQNAGSPFPQDNTQIAALPDATMDMDGETAPTTRIGVLLPLSGDAANAGKGLRNAALLAQFDVNNPNMVLQFYDTKGTPQGAQLAAQQAAEQGASLFIGPLFAHSVQAVTPIAQSHNIPVLSLSANPQATANNVFVTGFLIPPQVERVVGFAAAEGHTNFAILAPETAYGSAVAAAAEDAILKFGGHLVRSATFDPQKINFSDAIRQLTIFDKRKQNLQREIAKLKGRTDPASKAAMARLEQLDTMGDVDFDALILPVSGQTLHQVVTMLKYFDVDTTRVKLLGTLLWQDANLGTEPALRGAWYPAASRVGFTSFFDRYTSTFNQPPSQLSSLSYDLVTLSAALSQQSSTPWSLLTAPGGFIGVNGAFRMNYDGQVQRMLAVREVQAKGSRLVSPAPTTFASRNETPF